MATRFVFLLVDQVLPENRFALLLFEPEYERGLVPGGGPGGVAGQAGSGAGDCGYVCSVHT